MTTRRLVSVVVPTRDRPSPLRDALASIRALEDDSLAFEILVGDNGSDPATKAAVEAFGGRHFPVARNGAGAARNACLNAATGEYVGFLDDDDVWVPGHIRPHIARLERDETLGAILGQAILANADRTPTSDPWPVELPQDRDALLLKMLSGYYPQVGATLIRRSIRDKVGMFDEALLGDQDWDWHLRLARVTKVGFEPVPSVLFTIRPPGSYDDLQNRRIGFARRVFRRHAWANRGIWSSPMELRRAYNLCLWHYYDYFVGAAVERAEQGDREGSRRALVLALRHFPLRTLKFLSTTSAGRGVAGVLVKSLPATSSPT